MLFRSQDVGAAEIVRAAGGGIVVPGDAGSLASAIDRLVEDTSLACTMGEAGRRYVSERFGWSSVAARMEAVYQSLKV